jgi:pimeloyl-ACP methyl ester carboxylesterase
MLRFIIAMVLMVAATATYAQDIKVVGEDIRVPYGDEVQIFVRNKRPEGVQTFKSDRIAIIMHGATYPGSSTFDLPVAGKSWMDYMAERGFDVYALDLPGYGLSTRPAAMDLPPNQNPPFMRGTEAVKAIGAVVDYVRKRRGVEKVNLIGHSWGTTLCATYTTENQAKVGRLVLYAPIWLRTTASPIQVQGTLGAYRVVSREQTLARWLSGIPEDKKASLIPAGWFDMWASATFATDPKGEGKTLRAPNGVVQDGLEYWGATLPQAYWDPTKIIAPVLLVLAEWDRDAPLYMAQTLYPLLANAAWKRHVVLSSGTHFIVMESNRILLFRTVQQFLEEAPPIASATQ